ncbi:MAG: hypothetical protein BZ138_06005 [Methanosphaera sp. rholeuAM270]|nr:MAG: hypothetical protein BZ138_06005 [Methanosphaera sp. rholeuAM270]
MAVSITDILVKVEADLDDAIKNMGNLKQAINTTKQDVEQGLSPSMKKTETGIQKLGSQAKQVADIIKNAGSKVRSAFNEMSQGAKNSSQSFSMLKSAAKGIQKIGAQIKQVANQVKSAGSRIRTALSEMNQGAKNSSQSFSMLKSAASMTMGMIGYDLVSGFAEVARSSINAGSQIKYFGERLGMSQREITSFKDQLEGLQQTYRKVDMSAVGATATELGIKLGLPKQQMGDFSEMIAITSSAFVKDGGTQQQAILAVSDAMDGQFKRLQDIGITQEKLKENGWNGNISDSKSLMDAMNKTLDELGFTQTAKDITSLDDAWTALTVSGGKLLAAVIIPLTPYLIQLMEWLMKLGDEARKFYDQFLNLPQWQQFLAVLPFVITGIAGLVGSISAAGGVFAFLGSKLAFIISPLNTVKHGFSTMWDAIKGAPAKFSSLRASATSAFNGIKARISDVRSKLTGFYRSLRNSGAVSGLKGKLSGLKQAFISFGGKVKEATLRLKDFFVQAAKNAISGLRTGLSAAKTAFMGLGGAVKNALMSLKTFMLETVLVKVKTLAMAAAEKIATAAQAALNFVMSLNPIMLVVIAIIALIAILVVLYNKNETVRNALNNLASFIKGGLVAAFNFLKGVIEGAIQWLSGLWDSLTSMDTGSLVQTLMTIFAPIPTLLMNLFNQIAPVIMPALQGLWDWMVQGFSNLTNQIGTAIMGIPTAIWNMITSISSQIGNRLQIMVNLARYRMMMLRAQIIGTIRSIPARVAAFFQQMVTAIRIRMNLAVATARAKAIQLRNRIATALQSLPGRIRSIFTNVINGIKAKLSEAVSNAREKAREIYDNIVNKIKEIPGIVEQELAKIPGKISSGLAAAAEAAKNGAFGIVSAFAAGMWINSPGKIYWMTHDEFTSLAGVIDKAGVSARKSSYDTATGIVKAWTNAMPGALTLPSVDDSGLISPFNTADNILEAWTDTMPSVFSLPDIDERKLVIPVNMARIDETSITNPFNTATGIMGAWTNSMPSTLTLPDIDESSLTSPFNTATGIIESWKNSMSDVFTLPSVDEISVTSPFDMPMETATSIMESWTSNMPDTFSLPDIDEISITSPLDMSKGIAQLLSRDLTSTTPKLTQRTSNVTNNQQEDHSTIIHIDSINLDCNNLTQAQSRRILYDALQGLYPGGN